MVDHTVRFVVATHEVLDVERKQHSKLCIHTLTQPTV